MSDEKVKSKKSKATFQAGCKSPIEIDLQISETPLEEKTKQSRRSTSRGRNPSSKQVQIESDRKPEPERVPVDLEESDEEEQQVPNKPKKNSRSKAKMRESFFRMGDMPENLRWPFYVIRENWQTILIVGVCCMYLKGIPPPSNVDIIVPSNNPTTTDSLAIDEMQIDLLPLIGMKTDLRYVDKLLEGRLNENETVMKISDVELPTIERILGHMKYLENLIAQKKKVEEAVAAAAQSENAEKLTEKQSEANSTSSNETINSVSETINLAKAIAHITQSIKTLQEQVGEMKQRQHQTGAKVQETVGLADDDGMKNELEENKATPKPETTTSPVPSAENSSHLKKQKQHNQSLVQEQKSTSISAM